MIRNHALLHLGSVLYCPLARKPAVTAGSVLCFVFSVGLPLPALPTSLLLLCLGSCLLLCIIQ